MLFTKTHGANTSVQKYQLTGDSGLHVICIFVTQYVAWHCCR